MKEFRIRYHMEVRRHPGGMEGECDLVSAGYRAVVETAKVQSRSRCIRDRFVNQFSFQPGQEVPVSGAT
jgi:hypothetical protein